MILRLSLFSLLAAGLAATAAAAQPIDLTPGDILTRTAAGETGITYHVLAPADYDTSGSPPPIVIAFSPSGDGLGILDKLKDGVSPAGWILVGCDQLKNGLNDRELALKMEDEVLDDILRNVPHDPSRIYLAGFSGGAMRSYDLTTRRPEPFAGILAYGGWLGGPEYQMNAFREGLTVAMINGTQDRGAGPWVASDTTRLRELNGTVKHYYFVGGHTIAPAEVTAQAVTWLEQQWHATPTDKSPLEILYVGDESARTKDFNTFLSAHFAVVKATTPESLTLTAANRADVLILDAPITSLPDNFTKAMVLVGESAHVTAERYGSKLLPLTIDPHSLTRIGLGPLVIINGKDEPTVILDNIERVSQLTEAEDTERVASDSQNTLLIREAHRLFWSASADISELDSASKESLIKAVKYVHQFDGHQQTVYRGLRTRAQLMALLEGPDLNRETLARWVAAKPFNQANHNLDTLRQLLRENEPYLHIPFGSGLFQINAQARALGTPNNQIESIEKWIELLDDENHRKAALNLLLTYTGQRIRRQPAKWQTWLDENRDILRFRDDLGFQWHTTERSIK